MTRRPVFRQGDVLLDQVAELPDGAEIHPLAPERGRVILAYGEATGHFHAVPAAAGELIEVTTSERVDRYLRIRSRTQLKHQEHGPIELEPGLYRVRIQSEYVPDPQTKTRRRTVVD